MTLAERAFMRETLRLQRVTQDRVDAEAKAASDAVHAQHDRPRTRGECGEERPCPWIGCRYHLYLEVKENGNIRFTFPDREPWELAETCALDVAARGGITLEEVATTVNLTRERIRQLEDRALKILERVAGRLRP